MYSSLGDQCRGDMGLAAMPGREKEFRESLDKSLKYAKAMGCSQYVKKLFF